MPSRGGFEPTPQLATGTEGKGCAQKGQRTWHWRESECTAVKSKVSFREKIIAEFWSKVTLISEEKSVIARLKYYVDANDLACSSTESTPNSTAKYRLAA
jgi:hypothetical protein